MKFEEKQCDFCKKHRIAWDEEIGIDGCWCEDTMATFNELHIKACCLDNEWYDPTFVCPAFEGYQMSFKECPKGFAICVWLFGDLEDPDLIEMIYDCEDCTYER